MVRARIKGWGGRARGERSPVRVQSTCPTPLSRFGPGGALAVAFPDRDRRAQHEPRGAPPRASRVDDFKRREAPPLT